MTLHGLYRAQKPPNKLEVRIELATAAATKATLRVTYAVRNARWTPLYDARLDTGAKDRKPALELVRRAEITQATGEDWSNVALSVSTVRTARGGSAPDLNSLIVQYPPAPRPMGSANTGMMDAAKPLVRAARNFQTVDMFVPIIAISALGLMLNFGFNLLRARLLVGFPEES